MILTRPTIGYLRGAPFYRSLSRHFCSSQVVLQAKVERPKGVAYAGLTVGIPKETLPLEKRVAATPESVARLIKPGLKVAIEKGAGAASFFSDAAYEAAGATVVDNAWKNSDIILKVCCPWSGIVIMRFQPSSQLYLSFSLYCPASASNVQ